MNVTSYQLLDALLCACALCYEDVKTWKSCSQWCCDAFYVPNGRLLVKTHQEDAACVVILKSTCVPGAEFVVDVDLITLRGNGISI